MTVISRDALVGRAEELERLDASLGAAAGGATVAVLLEGEAGIGKTRLLEGLAARARERGFGVLRGEAHALERTRPLGALADALGAPAGAHPAEELLDQVERRAARGRLLLALEDLHWADESTLMAVRWIVRRLRGLPLLLALTLRPSPRGPELAQLIEDARRDGAAVIRLAPLGPPQVEELVRAELGRPPGPALAAAVHRAGGNPLWVVELVRALAAEGLLAVDREQAELASPRLPDSLRELVVNRVAQLPAETAGLLRAASILGDAFAPADLAAVTGRRALEIAEGLDEALRAGLLGEGPGGLLFRHALVRDAIYRDIPAATRLALHREAGRALAAAGAPLARVASQAFLGAAPGDLEAVGALRRAAAEAGPAAPAVAVDLLRRAETLLPDGHPQRDPVLAELVAALLLAGQVAQAAGLAEAVLGRPHAAAVDRPMRLGLMEALSLQNRPEDLVSQGAAALGAPGLGPADRALVTAQISYGHTFAGDVAGGERAGRRALALADAAGDAAMRAWCLTTLSVALAGRGRYGAALALAERAVRLARDPAARLRHPHFFLGLARRDADLMEGAAAAYRTAIRECEDLGSSWILPDARQMAAELRFLLGEWDDAVPELEAGLEAAADRGALVLVRQSRGYLAIVAAARGDRRAAEAALAPVGGGVPGRPSRYGDQVTGFAAALVAEADGRPADALAILGGIWDRDAARGDRYGHRLLGPAIVRLALDAGDEGLARRVAATAAAGAAVAPGVPSVRAAALRCRAMADRDAGAALAAVALARRSGRALDAAGACEDAARALAALGRAAEARGLLDEAVDRYEALDAAWLAARAGAALRDAGGRRGRRGPRRRPERGWASLTPSERAVAELVTEGLTNREVGRRLFVSPHTVNSHLRSAFRKLGVTSRAALAATVARGAAGGGGAGEDPSSE